MRPHHRPRSRAVRLAGSARAGARRAPGLTVGQSSIYGYVVRHRGDCTPAVPLDGRPIANAADATDTLGQPSDILGIEVYNSAMVPPQYSGLASTGCGAVLRWTERRRPARPPLSPLSSR